MHGAFCNLDFKAIYCCFHFIPVSGNKPLSPPSPARAQKGYSRIWTYFQTTVMLFNFNSIDLTALGVIWQRGKDYKLLKSNAKIAIPVLTHLTVWLQVRNSEPLNFLVCKIGTISALHVVIERIKWINTCKCHMNNAAIPLSHLGQQLVHYMFSRFWVCFSYPLSYPLCKFLVFQWWILLNFQTPWACFPSLWFSGVLSLFIAGTFQPKISQLTCTSV